MFSKKELKLIESLSIIIHSFIRAELSKTDFYTAIKSIAMCLVPFIENTNISYKDFDFNILAKIAKKILTEDKQGELVSSCVSISILIHLLLCIYNIDSYIIIGVCVNSGKTFSHAWVVSDNKEYNYKFDNYEYKEINRINLKEVLMKYD